MSGFEELIKNLQEQHPSFHKYNQIYAEETSKIHSSFISCIGATGAIGITGAMPEIEKYKSGIFEVENDAEEKEKEMLRTYWGLGLSSNQETESET